MTYNNHEYNYTYNKRIWKFQRYESEAILTIQKTTALISFFISRMHLCLAIYESSIGTFHSALNIKQHSLLIP